MEQWLQDRILRELKIYRKVDSYHPVPSGRQAVCLLPEEIQALIILLETQNEQTQLYAGKPENLPVPKGENPSSAAAVAKSYGELTGNQQGRT